MKWLKGDVISAFAVVPEMRCRAEHYQQLSKLRDQWLQDLHDYACSTEKDFEVFAKLQRRIGHCATQLIWGAGKDGRPERLLWGNFCENNICPICAKKKSLRLSRVLNEMMEKLDAEGYKFYHMVFSDKNCTLDNLKATIEKYSVSWNRLNKSFICRTYEGYFLSTEYTLNWNGAQPEFHVHYHVVVACHPDKYKAGDTYVDFETLRRLWARSLKIPKNDKGEYEYLPFASVYEVRKGDGQIFGELTKYLFDFTEFFDFCREHPYSIALGELFPALQHKNFHRGSGVLALSAKNLYFVQSVQASEYVPEFFICTGLNSDRVKYSLRYACKLDESPPIYNSGDSVKDMLRTYIAHQAYYYGFGYKQEGRIHLPPWWEDLSVDPPPPDYTPTCPVVPGELPPLTDIPPTTQFGKFYVSDFSSVSWDEVINQFEEVS